MYHPLQHRRGSSGSTRTPESSRVRRISSPDLKVRYSTHQQTASSGGESRKRIVRHGSFQGSLREGCGGLEGELHPGRVHSGTHRDSSTSPAPHRTPQTAASSSASKQSLMNSTGHHHAHHVSPSRERVPPSTGVATGVQLSYPGFQVPWERTGSSTDAATQLKTRSDSDRNSFRS